jgi:hypothetical protein
MHSKHIVQHDAKSGSWALTFSEFPLSDKATSTASRLLVGEVQAVTAMAIQACNSNWNLDKSVQIFHKLRHSAVSPSLSCYNAVLDACARATVLWNSSAPVTDVNINALASLSGSGISAFTQQKRQHPFGATETDLRVNQRFSRANWSEAIRLITWAISDGTVPLCLLVPVEKQSKDAATLVVDASIMSVGLALACLHWWLFLGDIPNRIAELGSIPFRLNIIIADSGERPSSSQSTSTTSSRTPHSQHQASSIHHAAAIRVAFCTFLSMIDAPVDGSRNSPSMEIS